MTPVARAALLALRDARRRRAGAEIARLDDLLDAALRTGGSEAATAIVRYALFVGRGRRVGRTDLARLTPKVREVTMTLGQSLMEQGRKQGRREGLEAGRAEERRSLVEKQLRLKFGRLPRSATARLARATVRDLGVCAARVLRATTLDEVLRGIGDAPR
jgi:hypothetical protein